MGRSTSCLKIITCGSDSADNDDLESKSSADKRGWSFRKRSTGHRVLSNTVISETPPSTNKESPDSDALNFQQLDNSNVPEKVSVVQCTEEKTQLPGPVESELSEIVATTTNECEVDDKLDEFVVIIIQAAIRGFLAQRELLKLKKVIMLQAAVRGHLVRRHAVGTLRCVQAIVKMQTLVRARRARLSMEGSCIEKKSDENHEKDSHGSVILEKENSATKPKAMSTSIEKLLSNRFASQLMKSTPKTKHIHVKCDPSKPNSVWNWLERWMSVSSAEQTAKLEPVTEQLEGEKNESIASPVEISSDVFCQSADSKSVKETVAPLESEENLITHDADEFKFHACLTTYFSARENLEQPLSENTSESNVKEITSESIVKETSTEIISDLNQSMQSDSNSQTEFSFIPKKPELEAEQPKRSMKRFASEQLDTEGKKFVFGSRKTSNTAFIAAQSKFEELTSTANSSRSISSSHQDVTVESKMDTASSEADTVKRIKQLSIAENTPYSTRVQYDGSECGTELSITSTLDSPDRSEVGATEYEHEAKVLDQETSNSISTEKLDVEVKEASVIPVTNLSDSINDQPEKLDHTKGESDDSVVVGDSSQIEQKPERSSSDLQRELDSEMGHQAYRSSSEASPRSHMAVPESQGTPSSQVSVKTKKNKTGKSGNQKRKSLSAAKRSPSNPNHDSGARSSTEQLPRDQKNGKRRNSFGSPKPEHIDQEPRDSSSSNSLPHFMQATESARAKLNANNSPRSSPDVQDRDIYIKKRHSLPGANGRQGSPRIQRSMSQAQQGAKGNGTPPPLHGPAAAPTGQIQGLHAAESYGEKRKWQR